MIPNRLSALALAVLLVSLAAVAGVAHAHHGFTGRYNTAQPIWLEGQVVRTSFARPHATISIRSTATTAPDLGEDAPDYAKGKPVVREEDRKDVQIVEFPPVAAFFGMSDRVKAGDRVQILALRNCREPHQLRSQWIRLASGELIAPDMRMSSMDAGC